MIKCIYATKLGDSLLRDENGNLISIHPDTFYNQGIEGFWMMKLVGDWWKILRVMDMR